MLVASGVAKTEEEALAMLNDALNSGAGLRKLKEMITAQGGDCRVCDDVSLLPQAPVLYPVKARQDGCLAHVNGTALGLAAQRMGAGRISKADIIDPAVGFVMEKRIGDFVKTGDVVCTLHAASEQSAKETEQRILDALTFTAEPAPKARLLYALVKPEGVTELEG